MKGDERYEEIDFLLDNYRTRLYKLYHKIDLIVDSMNESFWRAKDYPEDLSKDDTAEVQQFLEDIGLVLLEYEPLFDKFE
uniref:Uncharacterized protein n=1 Tax=viral metagenome TaxID=1070528 RepID=A0A6M3LU43_9ZZZZ